MGHDLIILNFAGVCITNDSGELLLQRRSGTDNIWGLPGGALEVGESVAEAAIREAMEETGLTVVIDYLIGVYSKYFFELPHGDKGQAVVHLFKGTVLGGELRADNIETFDLQYFGRENLPPLFNAQHADMVQDFFDGKMGVYK